MQQAMKSIAKMMVNNNKTWAKNDVQVLAFKCSKCLRIKESLCIAMIDEEANNVI